jgi:hypothetical protein
MSIVEPRESVDAGSPSRTATIEGNLAWELVEQNRDILNEAERHIVFVHLGVGDYPPVFRCMLNAVAREGTPLTDQTVQRLKAWADAYDRHREFASVLGRVLGYSDPAA